MNKFSIMWIRKKEIHTRIKIVNILNIKRSIFYFTWKINCNFIYFDIYNINALNIFCIYLEKLETLASHRTNINIEFKLHSIKDIL